MNRDDRGDNIIYDEGCVMIPEQPFAVEGQTTPPSSVPPPSPALPARSPGSPSAGLTAREREVLRLLTQGLTNPQIARRLVISLSTVNTHVGSIYNKLNVSTRSAATRSAIERHLV